MLEATNVIRSRQESVGRKRRKRQARGINPPGRRWSITRLTQAANPRTAKPTYRNASGAKTFPHKEPPNLNLDRIISQYQFEHPHRTGLEGSVSVNAVKSIDSLVLLTHYLLKQ